MALQLVCCLPAFTVEVYCVKCLPPFLKKSEARRLLSYRFGLPLVMSEYSDREGDMEICGNSLFVVGGKSRT